jgi:PAS domain-containing protein
MSAATIDRHVARPVACEPLARERLALGADERCFGPAAIVALLAQLPVAVFLADRQGRLVYANAAARREIAHLPDVIGSILGRVLLTGETVRGEEIELTAVGACRRWAAVSATPLASTSGGIDGAVLTIEDLTDRKRVASWEPVMESLVRL